MEKELLEKELFERLDVQTKDGRTTFKVKNLTPEEKSLWEIAGFKIESHADFFVVTLPEGWYLDDFGTIDYVGIFDKKKRRRGAVTFGNDISHLFLVKRYTVESFQASEIFYVADNAIGPKSCVREMKSVAEANKWIESRSDSEVYVNWD